MRPLLIRGGHLFDPGRGLDMTGSLLVTGGLISWIGEEGEEAPVAEVDLLPAEGLYVCPGFIDLHCHLREPGFEYKETIATGTAAAARGGFTTVCCMPNTQPPLDTPGRIADLASRAAADALVRVLPVAAISRGRNGRELVDMAALAQAGVVGFSDDGDPVADAELMRRALLASRDLHLPVISHCEDRQISRNGVMNRGPVSERLGVAGIPSAAEVMMVSRDIGLARETGGWLHIAHISAEDSVDLLARARAEGVNVTAEVTPHHLTLTEELVINLAGGAKVNPPLRSLRDVREMVRALRNGTIDVIATDHAPHAAADKAGTLEEAAFGFSGLETAFGSVMSLYHSGEVPLATIITSLTGAPARILGGRFGWLGELAPGAQADITIFDPDREWTVDPAAFASRGRNTPLAGTLLRGKVLATIFRGRRVWQDRAMRARAARRG